MNTWIKRAAVLVIAIASFWTAPQLASAQQVCTYGYAKGATWSSASIPSACNVKMQARISRYYGGIQSYYGPQAASSYVSSSVGTSAGNHWRGQILANKGWSNWASIP